MKKLLSLSILVMLVCALVHGQAANQVFSNDTTKGAQTKYFTGAKASANYQGIAGFVFTTAHDVGTFYLQGCYTSSAWYDIDTVAASGASAVNKEMYQIPPKYLNYRLKAVGNGGDTCYITNIRYILKY